MFTSEETKQYYWDWFLENTPKSERPFGMTDKRLEKVRGEIFVDEFFWSDVYHRHGGHNDLNSFKEENSFVFEHCQGNFFGMIYEVMILRGIVKI